jgi:hypothetical protein
VSAYPDPPRRVVLTLADLRALTVLERARACAISGVADRDLAGLLRTVAGRNSEPAELELAVTLLYAMVLQLERRRDPAISWEDVQTWDVAIDLDANSVDPIADAEAAATVDAALATGLPPAIAGDLTMAQLERYGQAAETRQRGRRSRARA